MNKVEVNIYGKDYTVVGDQNPEHIARVAAHVDSKMKETAEAALRRLRDHADCF